MKTTKRILAVVLTVMMVVAMVPMMAISASAETTGTISNGTEFKNALAAGGTYELTKDITVTSLDGYNMVNADTTIIGNGHKIGKSFLGAAVFATVEKNVTFNVENVVFDGGNKVLMAVTAKQESPNGCTINLTGCTVQNFGSTVRPFGAVYYFGDSKGTLTNCTFQNNKSQTDGDDVWAGAAADVTISGGTYSEVFANGSEGGSKAEITLLGDAVVETANSIVPESIVPVNATVAGTEYNNVISNGTEFKNALAAGGTYELTKDITVTSLDGYNMVNADTTIIGNGHKIGKSFLGAAVFATVEKNVTFNAENVVFDGGNKVLMAVTAKQESPNGCTINLTDCTVQNFGSTVRPFGAVYYYGDSKGTLTNCTFEGNKSQTDGDDVWAGAAADVTINGGTYNEVYGNANSGTAAEFTINGNAEVGKLNLGSDVGHTAAATIADTATVTNVNVGGKEAVLTEDNQIISTGGEVVAPNATDTFGQANPFTRDFELMGVQTKAEVANSLRFVSVIDSDLLDVADDYGYIVGTTKMAKADAMAKAGDITVEDYAKYKVSCETTSNSISGDYGKYDTNTSYKYVTAAVEGITDTSKTIFARVYVTVGNTTYYGDYIDSNEVKHAGCATSLAELG